MSCRIIVTKDFLRQLKHLAKKYKSIKTDVADLGKELSDNPFQGADLGQEHPSYRHTDSLAASGGDGGQHPERLGEPGKD